MPKKEEQKQTNNFYVVALIAVVAIVAITVITVSVINAKAVNKNAPTTYSFDENIGGYATAVECPQGTELCADGKNCCFRVQSV